MKPVRSILVYRGLAVVALLLACVPLGPGAETREIPLPALEVRCRKLEKQQSAIQAATRKLHQNVRGQQVLSPGQRQTFQKLAQEEQALVAEAKAIIDLLNKEGVAVAFTEVFQELRQDMQRVQQRLEKFDAGPAIQALQQDILDTLQEMVDALKK